MSKMLKKLFWYPFLGAHTVQNTSRWGIAECNFICVNQLVQTRSKTKTC